MNTLDDIPDLAYSFAYRFQIKDNKILIEEINSHDFKDYHDYRSLYLLALGFVLDVYDLDLLYDQTPSVTIVITPTDFENEHLSIPDEVLNKLAA